jgi:cytochrome c553
MSSRGHSVTIKTMRNTRHCNFTIVRITSGLVALLACTVLTAGDTSGTEYDVDGTPALALTPDRQHGAGLFDTCAACHGATGLGTDDGAIPLIAGQHFAVILKQLIDFRNHRRREQRMEHFTDREHLPAAQDLVDVAAYVSHLPRSISGTGVDNGGDLAAGASAYLSECAGCHGATGQGNASQLRPRLAGQRFEYLLRQFADKAPGQAQTAHAVAFGTLTPNQLRGIANYLSRQMVDARE